MQFFGNYFSIAAQSLKFFRSPSRRSIESVHLMYTQQPLPHTRSLLTMSATSPSGNTHAANSARGDGLASFGSKSSKRLSFERSEGVAGRQGSLSLL